VLAAEQVRGVLRTGGWPLGKSDGSASLSSPARDLLGLPIADRCRARQSLAVATNQCGGFSSRPPLTTGRAGARRCGLAGQVDRGEFEHAQEAGLRLRWP